eukprot:m.207377 g.207377  ORF g.207377 m.207377 type:complete len:770 (-) comp17122_c0_seq25:781-3090(-)
MNQRDTGMLTPLMLAARNGHTQCIMALVKDFNADVTATDFNGFAVLHWLASNGRADPLELLLNDGFDIGTQDKHSRVLLHVACHAGHVTVLKLLLSRGIDINATDSDGRTALHNVCLHSQLTCARPLTQAGALLTRDHDGFTAMHYALGQSHAELTLHLLQTYPECLKDVWAAISSGVQHPTQVAKVLTLWLVQQQSPALQQDILDNVVKRTVTQAQELLCYHASEASNIEPSKRWTAVLLYLVEAFKADDTLAKADALQLALVSLLTNLVQIKTIADTWLAVLLDELQRPGAESATDDLLPLHKLYQQRLATVIQSLFDIARLWPVAEYPDLLSDLSQRELEAWLLPYLPVFRPWVAEGPDVFLRQFGFVLQCPGLLTHFGDIVQASPFEARYDWLLQRLPGRQGAEEPHVPTMSVARNNLLMSSCQRLMLMDIDTLQAEFAVQFHNEAGHGEGVKREWFSLLSKELFDPDYALFEPSEDGAVINPASGINTDHLSYFKFAGRLLALAFIHRVTVGIELSKLLACQMLKLAPTLEELAFVDPQWATSTRWILDNNVDDAGLDLVFALTTTEFGEEKEHELCHNGASQAVTEVNKHQYVAMLCQWKATDGVRGQVEALADGWLEVIPDYLSAIISVAEVKDHLAGVTTLDPQEWRQATSYNEYADSDQVIQWFWELVETMLPSERQQLLLFCTGCPRLPHGGFAQLQHGDHGCAFTISRVPLLDDSVLSILPTASTCFNLLKLPAYGRRELVAQAFKLALAYGKDMQMA